MLQQGRVNHFRPLLHNDASSKASLTFNSFQLPLASISAVVAYFLLAFTGCLRPSSYPLRPASTEMGLGCWPSLASVPSQSRHLTYATSCRTSDLQSKTGKPAIVRVFQPTLSATDGPRNRHYLQLNLQSAGSDLQSSPANRHYLQLKRRPETHLIVPNLDVVCWTELLDGGKPRQTLRGLRRVWRPTNGRFMDRPKSGFSVADNSGLNAFQLQIIPVEKWR